MAAVIHGRSQCQHNGLVGDVFPKFDITNPHPSTPPPVNQSYKSNAIVSYGLLR